MQLFIFFYIYGVNEIVGKVIRELRNECNLSQEALADKIDSHQVYISEIEKGQKLPSLFILNNIAHACSITLTELVSRIDAQLSKE